MRHALRDRLPLFAAAATGLLVFALLFRAEAARERAAARAALAAAAGAAKGDLFARLHAGAPAPSFLARALFDPATLRVEPPRFREPLFRLLAFRAPTFDAETFDRLKALERLGDPALSATALAAALDDRADRFALEKAVLHLRLLEHLLALGRPPREASAAFRRLLEGVADPAERRFLASRHAKILERAGEAGSPAASSAGEPPDGPLLSALREVALGAEGGFPRAVELDGAPMLLVAGRGPDGTCVAGLLPPAAAAGFLAARHALRLGAAPEPDGVPFAGPFLALPAAAPLLPPGAASPLVYLPLLALAAVLALFRARERRAAAESERMAAFVSGVAHQLKTPLSAALLHLELSAQHAAGGDAARAEASVAAALQEARSLAFLFENYVALRRLFDAGDPLALEPLDLSAETALFLRANLPATRRDRLAVTRGPLDARVLADRWALVTILGNLLANAAKYGARDGKAEVFLGLVPPPPGAPAGTAALAFRDRGPGIAPGDRPRLFELFAKGEAGRDDPRASGIGLSLARSLARRMGGDLALDPDWTSGTGFLLTLRKADGA